MTDNMTNASGRQRSEADARHPGQALGLTILVVDDDRCLRRLLQSILRTAGFDVISAASGEEALHLAASHSGSIDLVLTDIVMPGLKGPDLAQRLRCRRPGVPVLLMTGASEAEPGVLQKPFSASALLAAIRGRLEASVPV
jgi:two-component system cell cycle sensor histidine kinase/response regulator CckA